MLGFLIQLALFPVKLAMVLLNLIGRIGTVLLSILLNPLVLIIIAALITLSMI